MSVVSYPRNLDNPLHRERVAEMIGLSLSAEDELTEVLEASAGWIYSRKGYLSCDSIGGDRNTSYGSPSDDLVLMAAVRISAYTAKELGVLRLDQEIRRARAGAMAREVQNLRNKLKAAEDELIRLRGEEESKS